MSIIKQISIFLIIAIFYLVIHQYFPIKYDLSLVVLIVINFYFFYRCQIILAPSKFYLGKVPNRILYYSPQNRTAKISLSTDKNFNNIQNIFYENNIFLTSNVNSIWLIYNNND